MTEHDPGGKVRIPLGPGSYGDAHFSRCGRYRHTLSRWQGDGLIAIDTGRVEAGFPITHIDIKSEPFALWIGMNPSTADAHVNDPTVLREVNYTHYRLGLSGYVKCNVMDYRATDPKALRAPGVDPCSPANIRFITGLAPHAARVIAAWGALPKPLRPYADRVERELTAAGIELWCVGFTKDGSPRHPLYVRGDAPLVRYPRAA